MTDEPEELPEGNREDQQAAAEATERQMRLQTWLNGLLAGGPSPVEAVTPWRDPLPKYDGAGETFTEDPEGRAEDNTKLIEEPLMAAIIRLRRRREQEGSPPLEIHEKEQRRRLVEVIEAVKADRGAGVEFTPMDIVLAARYIEGVMTPEDYRSRR